MDFSAFNVWGVISVVGVLLVALLIANMLKRRVPFLKKSLIPTSVLAGALILIVSTIYTIATKGDYLFETAFFGSPSQEALDAVGSTKEIASSDVSLTGLEILEIITYHSLALGFIATAFKPMSDKLTKKRRSEVFNTGITTVSTYLLQAVVGMTITMIGVFFIDGLKRYGGILLAFGFGQGTGQALNFGSAYEEAGFIGGADFGLSIASLGFISAAIGGVIYLNVIRRRARKKLLSDNEFAETMLLDKVQTSEELPMESSGVDKITVQLAFVIGTYFATYGVLALLALIAPGLKTTIYGFNFLIGVLLATLFCFILRFCKKKKIVHHEYINPFLMKRIAGFFFDLMIISGVAAIKPDTLGKYWHILLVIALLGATATFFYLWFVSRKLFPRYRHQQFLAMYGMLTGTASTGIILLREWDPKFETCVADNLVYQNLPAIVFGFPIMLVAAKDVVSVHPYIVYGVLAAFFVIMNLVLFRSYIFKKKRKRKKSSTPSLTIDSDSGEITGEVDIGSVE